MCKLVESVKKARALSAPIYRYFLSQFLTWGESGMYGRSGWLVRSKVLSHALSPPTLLGSAVKSCPERTNIFALGTRMIVIARKA